MRRMVILSLSPLILSACGEQFASRNAPGRPCTEISAGEYRDHLTRGAVGGTATISASGTVSMSNAPGVVHCATYSGTMKPCRRPDDYVIRYTLADGRAVHVLVPAGQQYRFRIGATPTTCEIVT